MQCGVLGRFHQADQAVHAVMLAEPPQVDVEVAVPVPLVVFLPRRERQTDPAGQIEVLLRQEIHTYGMSVRGPHAGNPCSQ